MESVFLKIFNMSITAGWLVPAVVVMRFLLKKAPKALTVLMWGLVGLRLILPWSLESIFSLVPSAETVPQDIVYSNSPSINSGVQLFNSSVNPVISETLAPTPENSVNPMQIIVLIATVVWIAGMVLMAVYTVISYLKLRLRVREAVELRDNIYLCDRVDTPFILGVIRPKIYLPSNLSETDAEYVIAHEKAHLKRRDHLIKPFGFLLLTVYWFNPLLWVAYVLLCRDIELACDEKVIKELGSAAKKPYSDALINCSIPRRTISACPLAFGEVGVKPRIKAVLSYKKPAFWIIIAAVVASIVLSICFLTNPKTERLKSIEHLNLDYTLENTINVYVGDSEGYFSALTVDREILGEITDLKVSAKPVSQNRSEDRDADHVIVLQSRSDIKSISSTIEGVYICFNTGFSQVWINDGVKPTLSYKVFDPEKAQELFGNIKTANNLDSSTVSGAVYTSVSRIFENGSLSFTYSLMPKYFISDSLDLYIDEVNSNNSSLSKIGGLEEVGLTADNFDTLFSNEIWYDGYSAKALREGNTAALCAKSVDQKALYYVLMQKNGDIFFVYCNRFSDNVYLASVVYKTEKSGTQSAAVEYLKEKFPEYFDLPTDKGLEVYVWQPAHNTYLCGLMEGTNREKTDEEKANLKPATIQEMRLILSYYSLPASDIFLIAYRNPLSSYFYEIDDAYYEELCEIFWHDDVLSSFGGVDGPENVTVSSTAVYGYLSSPDPVRPTLELTKETGLFSFSWSGFSSYIAVGSYQLTDDMLTLKTSDGLYHYCFEVVGDRFKFLADSSSPIPTYKYSSDGEPQSPVPDGAMFEPVAKESVQFNVPVYDSIVFDVDGDGVDEVCTITPGPTSGLFTVTLRAYSAKSDYRNIFMPGDPTDLAFKVDDGKLMVQCTSPEENKPIWYEVSVRNHNLVLTFDESMHQVPYWGAG